MNHLEAYLPDDRSVRTLRLNMVSSLDGAATLGGRSGGLGGSADQALMGVLRMMADVILVGSSTVKIEDYQGDLISESAKQWRLAQGLPKHPKFVVASRTAGNPLETLLPSLWQEGHTQILCEGGPHIVGALGALDAIDELCLTLGPLLAGPGEDRITRGAPHPVRRMRLIHAIPDGDLLFLRYGRG